MKCLDENIEFKMYNEIKVYKDGKLLPYTYTFKVEEPRHVYDIIRNGLGWNKQLIAQYIGNKVIGGCCNFNDSEKYSYSYIFRNDSIYGGHYYDNKYSIEFSEEDVLMDMEYIDDFIQYNKKGATIMNNVIKVNNNIIDLNDVDLCVALCHKSEDGKLIYHIEHLGKTIESGLNYCLNNDVPAYVPFCIGTVEECSKACDMINKN